MIRLTSSLFKLLPQNSGRIYDVCKRYVDNYNGENNSDLQTNGELRLLQQFLVNSHVVFDVGANVGEWASSALKINPKSQLHCFEPSPTTFQQLSSRAFPSNVVLNNFGLSSSKRDENLHIFYPGSGMNSLYIRQGLEDRQFMPQATTELIHLDTLDSYCERNKITQIDFLRLDVEGHELDVLKGAQGILSMREVKAIQFEYGGCNIDARVLLKDFFEHFATLPYRFYKIYPDRLVPFEHYSQRLENFQYQNWLILSVETIR